MIPRKSRNPERNGPLPLALEPRETATPRPRVYPNPDNNPQPASISDATIQMDHNAVVLFTIDRLARSPWPSGHRRRARGHGRQSPRLWYQADFGLRRVPTRVHAPDWRGSAVRGRRRGGNHPVARRASRRIRLDARSCSPGNIGRRWSLRPSRGSHGPCLVRAPGRGALRRDGRGSGWAPLGIVSARSLLTTGSRYISSNGPS